MKPPLRPSWIEIDLQTLRRNFALFAQDRPKGLKWLAVVKDRAYGHGMVEVAKVALEAGAAYLGVATLDEAVTLREHGIRAPILLFGERHPREYRTLLHYRLTPCINSVAAAAELVQQSGTHGRPPAVHVEVDTGLSRYGVRWTHAAETILAMAAQKGLSLEGIMSHFAMSDELDKSYALLQLERFEQVLQAVEQAGLRIPLRHMCNTGGYLDLPQAHFEMVRIGILPLGVYPSQVCRRIEGLRPVMCVKSRIAAIQEIEAGDKVGYGMHYTAPTPRRIAVLPIGYGDGLPRLRNRGHVLIHGKRAPIVGGNAMDATMVDITHIPRARQWDEVVIMGRQGDEEISAHEIASWKGSVSYDILTGWRARLPRVYLDGDRTS